VTQEKCIQNVFKMYSTEGKFSSRIKSKERVKFEQ